ncbi:MAG: NUDIX hydrolase [Oscillospiraceae bacterium]|nr:NUDIX hydrolase [Oscillospiraceae bacterium]
MQGYNVIVVFNKEFDRMLMCRRTKEPYKGLSNFVGGKIEKGEDGYAAAYREMKEESGISEEDINLMHLVDFTYPLDDCYVEVYVGRLKNDVVLKEEKHPLYWSELDKNFFDSSKYAGYGNIGHIMELIWLYKDKQLKI